SASIKQRCFLRVSILSMYNCYEAVVWLGSDKEETGKRPQNALLTTPSIIRTMIDNLFTVVFMFDQGRFLPNYVWFAKSSYRDAWEELQRYKKDLSQHHEYIAFFEEELNKYAVGLKEHLQVTDAEISNPSQLPRWPTISQALSRRHGHFRNLNHACRTFLVWLNDWSYREVSQIAHHSAWGVSKIGAFFLKESLGKDMRDRIEGDGIERFRSGQISNALATILCFASEINQYYDLDHDDGLRDIWSYLDSQNVTVIQEAWHVRYKQLLSPQPS
ncbi:MAG TPA: hypothetical protein VFN53_09615, partial [Acidobacteriaceae bacterium]|nr:hypothetical protein [Acidobacteriaceae bacterium]